MPKRTNLKFRKEEPEANMEGGCLLFDDSGLGWEISFAAVCRWDSG